MRFRNDLLTARHPDLARLQERFETATVPGLAEVLAMEVSFGTSASVALVDWTTFYNATALLVGGNEHIDAFTALGDLTTLLGASIFYDRVLVLGHEDEFRLRDGSDFLYVTGDRLGVADALTRLSLPAEVTGTSALLDDCFASAVSNLRDDESGLIAAANKHWEAMLPPGTSLPAVRDAEVVGWTESADRAPRLRQLFWPLSGKINTTDINRVVVDNDIRTLAYENIAALLSTLLEQPDGAGPTIRYVGGALRSPMQAAIQDVRRQEWNRQPPATEKILASWWHEEHRHVAATDFPFWLPGVFADCDSMDDLARVVGSRRQGAKKLRASRDGLEAAVAAGNEGAYSKFKSAVSGNLWPSAVDAASVAAGTAVIGAVLEGAIGVPGTGAVVQAYGSIYSARATRLLTRHRKSQLRVLFTISEDAEELLNPQGRLREWLALPPATPQVSQVLAQLNTLQWRF